jgi:hypothetical protein
MVSCFSSLHYKISSEVSATAAMMRSMSSTVSIVFNLGLLYFDFFHDEGFMGETFLFLDASASSMGFLGGVTSSDSFLSYSPFSFSLSTSSPPLHPSESKVVSSDALFNSCTSYFFFLLLLLGAFYSSRVTIGLRMISRSNSSS